MSLSKSNCLYSNNCLHFFKVHCSIVVPEISLWEKLKYYRKWYFNMSNSHILSNILYSFSIVFSVLITALCFTRINFPNSDEHWWSDSFNWFPILDSFAMIFSVSSSAMYYCIRTPKKSSTHWSPIFSSWYCQYQVLYQNVSQIKIRCTLVIWFFK